MLEVSRVPAATERLRSIEIEYEHDHLIEDFTIKLENNL